MQDFIPWEMRRRLNYTALLSWKKRNKTKPMTITFFLGDLGFLLLFNIYIKTDPIAVCVVPVGT